MNVKQKIGMAFGVLATALSPSALMAQNDWKLVWSDEFNTDGLLDSKVWNYEEGFKRNHEAQWYQKANAYCKDGNLVIEARKEKMAPGRQYGLFSLSPSPCSSTFMETWCTA